MAKVFRWTGGERTLQAERVQGHRGVEQHGMLGRASLLIRWYNGWGRDRNSGKKSWRDGKELWRALCAMLRDLAFNPRGTGKVEGQDQVFRENFVVTVKPRLTCFWQSWYKKKFSYI